MSNLDEVVPCIHNSVLERIRIEYSQQNIDHPSGNGFWLPAKRMSLSHLCRRFLLLSDDSRAINMKRQNCEENFNYRHLVTYTILHRDAYSIYHYSRGKSGTEERLHSLRSIGVGGHVTTLPEYEGKFPSGLDSKPLHIQAAREVHEEVDIYQSDECISMSETQIADSLEYLGLLCYPPETPVDAVHAGLVFGLNVTLSNEFISVKAREDCLEDLRGEFIRRLQNSIKWENWSNFLLFNVISPVHIHKLIP